MIIESTTEQRNEVKARFCTGNRVACLFRRFPLLMNFHDLAPAPFLCPSIAVRPSTLPTVPGLRRNGILTKRSARTFNRADDFPRVSLSTDAVTAETGCSNNSSGFSGFVLLRWKRRQAEVSRRNEYHWQETGVILYLRLGQPDLHMQSGSREIRSAAVCPERNKGILNGRIPNTSSEPNCRGKSMPDPRRNVRWIVPWNEMAVRNGPLSPTISAKSLRTLATINPSHTPKRRAAGLVGIILFHLPKRGFVLVPRSPIASSFLIRTDQAFPDQGL